MNQRRAILRRVTLGSEIFLVLMGALGIWQARAAGQPVSRPVAIAFWAGLVGLVASVLAPQIRAQIERRRRPKRPVWTEE
jgi:hypothetical protein